MQLLRLGRLTLRNLVLKLLGFGTVLLFGTYLLEKEYFSIGPVVLTVLTLTVIGVVADYVVVPRAGNLPSLLLGFPAMTVIIWAIAHLYPPTRITLATAVVMALFLGPIEYALHQMILKNLPRV